MQPNGQQKPSANLGARWTRSPTSSSDLLWNIFFLGIRNRIRRGSSLQWRWDLNRTFLSHNISRSFRRLRRPLLRVHSARLFLARFAGASFALIASALVSFRPARRHVGSFVQSGLLARE